MNVKSVFLMMGLLLTGMIQPVYAAIPSSEREALIALYQSTAGHDWDHRDNWRNAGDTDFNDPGTECSWYGVQCSDDESMVEVISLSANHLVGPIPSEIGDFQHLTTLDLDSNELNGTIPSEIGNLADLQVLHLQYNADLGGEIPPEIGDLSNLTNLGIFNTSVSGEIPPEIGTLSNLISLNFSVNELSGGIPPEIGDLSALKYLDFSHNFLDGTFPPEIGRLSHLVDINLSQNELNGSLPDEIANLISLEKLRLDGNDFSGELPLALTHLYKLSFLAITYNELTGEIPTGFGNLNYLVSVNLVGNHFVGEIPADMGNLRNVTHFDLSGNMLSGEIPPELANMTLSPPTCHCVEIQYNAMHTDDPDLVDFLDTHQYMYPWRTTQTVAPENVHIVSIRDTSVMLAWDEPAYPDFAEGFELYSRPTGSPEEWAKQTFTTPKSSTSFVIAGLQPGQSYDFVVKTFSEPQTYFNPNRVVSDPSEVVSGVTGDTGCPAPSISITMQHPWQLTVDGSHDSYRWSTGESGQNITVSPTAPTWYWVETSSTGPCDEYAAVLVEPNRVFSDGFELGDTTGWSGTQY